MYRHAKSQLCQLWKIFYFELGKENSSVKLINTAEEVRSFLGFVTYVGKFIPNLATITEPLRKLTKKKSFL